MEPPDPLIEDATLLAYAPIPENVRFTGRLSLYVDGVRLGPVPNLAICQPHTERGLLLMHCDADWRLLGVQAWNAADVAPVTTVDEMIEVADRYYAGLKAHWIRVRDA